MNQSDLIKSLSKTFGFPKSLAEKIFKHTFRTVAKETKRGNRVRIRNFGTFEARFSHGKRRAKFTASKNIFQKFGQEL